MKTVEPTTNKQAIAINQLQSDVLYWQEKLNHTRVASRMAYYRKQMQIADDSLKRLKSKMK